MTPQHPDNTGVLRPAQSKTSPEAEVSDKKQKCLPVPNVDKAEIQIDICKTSEIPGKES